MTKVAYPRRKVVSASESRGYFNCTLACGHSATAYGIRSAGDPVPRAPKTCSCRECATDEKKN